MEKQYIESCKLIEGLSLKLRNEFATRMDDVDIVEILEVLQEVEELLTEQNDWIDVQNDAIKQLRFQIDNK